MAITLSATSKANLKGVHPDLVKVVLRAAAICPADLPFKVTEGIRSVAQQRENIKKGVSWTMNSRHLTGHAVDIAPTVDLNGDGKVSTAEQYHWPLYYKLAVVIKQAAKDVGVPVGWGGDWKKRKDGPHWELPHKAYPATARAGFMASDEPGLRAALNDEPMAPETEHGAALKGAVAGLSGGAAGVGMGLDPTMTVVDSLSSQQYELSSGDLIRIVLAVVIIGLSAWYAYKVSRG